MLALLGAWGMRDVARVRGQLLAAQATLQRTVDNPAALATAEGRSASLADLDSALVFIDDARRDVRGSAVLSAFGALPLAGVQRSGLVALIDRSSKAATAGRGLLAKVNDLADRNRLKDGSVPVGSLGELQAEVEATGRALGSLTGPRSQLWGPVGDARRRFDDLVSSSSRRLTDAAVALGGVRSFVGSAGNRRYLVALENNAEMRDQGAVLSYVVASFGNGRVSFERRGSIADLQLTGPTATVVPEGTREVFGPIRPTQTWQSVNASADFPFSGQAMVDMYRQATGQSLDGVIALDIPGLAAMLGVIGPVSIDGVVEPITDLNLGRLLLHDFYEGLGPTSDQTLRRERHGEVVRAVVDRLTNGTQDVVSLGRALGTAAGGGHLRLWSASQEEETVFERTGLGGGPASKDADRTFHVAVQNRTASKLDYYVKPAVRQDVMLTKQGTAVVRTTVSIDNQAPVNGAPSYQLGAATAVGKPGDYLAWVLLWGPAGSRQLQAGVGESGLNLSQFVVAVPAGQRREVSFETVLPDAVRQGRLQLRLVPQPRLEPMALSVTLRTEGGSVGGSPASSQGPWDRVRRLDWIIRE